MGDQTPLNYFLVCPPELVSLAQWELKHKAHDLVQQISPQNGGVSFQGPATACQLNSWLKIPTRLLVELVRFKVRDLPKLYKKVRSIAWHRELYVFGLEDQGQNIEWKISARRSRLIHTEKIKQTLQKALADSLKSQPPRKAPKNLQARNLCLYVHLENDEFTLSWDTSGEALYKRGLKKANVQGPLRENLAQACLLWLQLKLKHPLDSPIELIDPMAGSGSFILEALTGHQSSGPYRDFTYQHLPRFQNLPKWEPEKPKLLPLCQKAYAFDLQTQALHQNLNELPQVDIQQGNAFELKIAPPLNGVTRWVVCNPPYGERVPKDFTLPQLLELMSKTYQAQAIGLLTPASWDIPMAAQKQELKVVGHLDLRNGGLLTRFWGLKRNQESAN